MLYTSCCVLHTPSACTYDNLLASQDVFIAIHLMSTMQLDRSRSPTMPCIVGVIGERERANLVVHLAAIFLYWSVGRRSYVGMARVHAQSQKPPNSEGLEL